MRHLFILNDPPYGSERSYNALRLAYSLIKREGEEVRVFLTGDAVVCAMAGQQTPDGFYNVERMLKAFAGRGGDIGCCGTCLKARGIRDELIAESARHSSLEELTDWTLWAERVLVF